MKTHLLCSVVVLFAIGCGPRQAATAWGYSHWYDRYGGASMGAFEKQQKQCLGQIGVADPADVVPDSPEENAFIGCMNAAGWCTQEFACEKPDA